MSYDYGMKFIGFTKAIYEKTFSSVQIHGCVAGHVQVECFIRKGCPTNVLLFTLALILLIACLIDIIQALEWDISQRKRRNGIHRRHQDLCDHQSGHSKIRELLSFYGGVTGA
jgi:hypothetical protein